MAAWRSSVSGLGNRREAKILEGTMRDGGHPWLTLASNFELCTFLADRSCACSSSDFVSRLLSSLFSQLAVSLGTLTIDTRLLAPMSCEKRLNGSRSSRL